MLKRDEKQVAEMSQALSAVFSDLDLGQDHHRDAPTVIGIEVSGLGVAVHCPHCQETHWHGPFQGFDYRGAHCQRHLGYWISSVVDWTVLSDAKRKGQK